MTTQPTDIWGSLEQVEAINASTMPKWRAALHQLFSGDEDVSSSHKAQILGVPTRRQLFRIGGTTLAGAALLAACGDDDDTTSATTTSLGDGSDNLDLTLAQTALSLEILAIAAYDTAAGSGLVTTPAVGEAAGLFKSHHEAHRGALEGAIGTLGGSPTSEANAAVNAAIVEPAVAEAVAGGGEARIVQLAYDLETAAAQAYVYAAGQLSTPALRSTIMTIGGVEARHAAILSAVQGELTKYFPDGGFVSSAPLPLEFIVTG